MRPAQLAPAALLACLAPAAAADSPASLGESARALLGSRCISCHGLARLANLDLRTRPAMLHGGTRGPAVVPGDASASLLYQAVARTGELRMPPAAPALTQDEVALLGRWIDAGAPWGPDQGDQSDASWWSFRKPQRPAVPRPADVEWVRTPVDAFILAELEARGLGPAAPAGRRTLVRRAYFDLHGLPPSPDEVEQFIQDPASDAYARLVDRLLASPRYGERWGRYWLDLVRYADTSGFETDHFYTTAWRYRDYVIDSYNRDKPHTTFVREQVAADELWPSNTDLEGTLRLSARKRENLERRIGTSLFTLGAFPIEYTYYGDLHRAEWRAEAVDVVGAAFLGLTLECARCHDHKSDPISQRDYYRLAAFFAGSEEREIPLGSLFDVQTSTRQFPLLEHARALKRMAKRARSDWSPQERQRILEQLGEAFLKAPDPMPTAKVLGPSRSVPDTHILVRGEFRRNGPRVEPGFPAAFGSSPGAAEGTASPAVPGRRAALARWLTDESQPLLGRVMANRIWQHHFGAGLVTTPNDFGRQGEPPSHPALLDWLAVEFAAHGWSVKRMHRLIMLSSAYRSSSVAGVESLARDPGNRYLSRMRRRRLDADALRDTVLAVSGSLNLRMGGVGVIPPLTGEEILAARMPRLWPANPDPSEHNRRSVYLQMKRSMALPLLQIFDAPDMATSCARREASTVAPQALALMNGGFALRQADRFAARIRSRSGDEPEAQADSGWRFALGRPPSSKELATAVGYIRRNSLARFCLLLFNMNEFIYVD